MKFYRLLSKLVVYGIFVRSICYLSFQSATTLTTTTKFAIAAVAIAVVGAAVIAVAVVLTRQSLTTTDCVVSGAESKHYDTL